MKHVTRIINSISYAVSFLGWGSIIIMGLVTIIAIILRLLRINSGGAFELVVLMGTVTFVSSLAYTQVKKEHIHVDVLLNRLPDRPKRFVQSMNHLLGLAACIIALVYTFRQAHELQENNQIMAVLFPVPSCIPAYFTTALLLLLTLVMITEVINTVTGRANK